MKSFLILIFSVFAISAFGQDTVVVTGFGSTAEEAKYDALRSAVEQVAGVMISAETRLEDGELIKDRIHTNAQGYIESYTVLSNVEDEGRYIATVKAKVSIKRIQEQITEISHLNDEKLSYEEASCQYTYGGAIMCKGGNIALFNMNYGIHADSYAILRYYTSDNITETQLYFRMTLSSESGFDTAADQDEIRYELKYVYMGSDHGVNPDRTLSQDYIVVLDKAKDFNYLDKYAHAGLEFTISGSEKPKTIKIPAAYIRGFIKRAEEELAAVN